MQFTDLKLAQPILRALAEEGYTTPTPIQARAIPPVLEGKDLLGCAQTGTGKTAAFALPILNRLLTAPADKTRRGAAPPRALILSPTRELATQIADSFKAYGRHTGLGGAVVYGGVSQFHQVRALHSGVDILVATPGRLIDLMEQGHANLGAVEVFVLDEADRMLDMGFIQPIRRIAAATPTARQTLLFSATMPKEIMKLADSLLRSPVKVAVTPVATAAPLIEQTVYMVPKKSKQALLQHMLDTDRAITRAVVFTRTKHGADRVARHLARAGVAAAAIHGNKAQNQRQRALDGFRSGRSRVLVATDVAARGLDVDDVSHVFNFDLPVEPEAYVHRIGRTGRAGAAGIAISFCDYEERGLLRDIEKLTGKPVPMIKDLPDLPEPPAPAPGERAEPVEHAPRRPAGPAHRAPASGHAHARPQRERATPAARNAAPAQRDNRDARDGRDGRDARSARPGHGRSASASPRAGGPRSGGRPGGKPGRRPR